MQNKLPNFLLVGAAKSGTTSLYRYLKPHPQVYMSDTKEPMFMISTIYEKLSQRDPRYKLAERVLVSSLDDYLRLFEEAQDEKARGEASAAYLYYHETAIPNIQRYLGDVRIVIILRNPVERAYSSYRHLVRDCYETASFEEFLEAEEERRRENWDILNYPKAVGFYYDQVRAYIDGFSRVKVCLFGDMRNDPVNMIQDVYEFLEVDRTFVPDTGTKFNQSGVPRNRLLHYLITEDNPMKRFALPVLSVVIGRKKRSEIGHALRDRNITKPQMRPQTRDFLKRTYREDVLKLQDLIDRGLTHWLQ